MNSFLIEQLGRVLLHSIWQISVIVLGYACCRWMFRSPRVRHGLGMLALAACVLWPMAQWMPPSVVVMPAPMVMTADTLDQGIPVDEAESPSSIRPVHAVAAPLAMQQLPARLLPGLALLWLVGVLLLTLRQGMAMWSLYRLRTRDIAEVTPAIRLLFEQTKTRLGVRRAVRLLASARVLAPVVVGSLRPMVLMPAGLLTGLPLDQIEALLAHELAHLRRWDDVMNLLQCVIETLLFYHPLVWWLSRRVREDRELCCDDLATARGIERGTLAGALGRLALWNAAPALAATGHMPVLARIQRLLSPAPTRVMINTWPVVIVVAVALSAATMGRANAQLPARGRILDRNGVVLAESASAKERLYPLKSLAGHVLGYTRFLNSKGESLVGGYGIEKAMNTELMAKKDVRLTLDAQVQQVVEEVLRKNAGGGGTVVLLDVMHGDILAMASSPTLDPNDFGPSLSHETFDRISKDPAMPLLHRATEKAYYLGSTFKLVSALAALKSGAIDADTMLESSAMVVIDGRVLLNWNRESEGAMSLVGALKRSSNTWFYQAALKTDARAITGMAADLGFGAATGLPIPEAAGAVRTNADPSASRKRADVSPVELAQLSIGQHVQATPLQIAVATAAIANGGRVLKPRLIQTDAGVECVTDLVAEGLLPEHLELVRQGMIAAVNDAGSTGKKAQVQGLSVAGKTGTTQSFANPDLRQYETLFTGFAPVEQPKVAIVVIYEGAPGESVSGGSSAAPMASEILTRAHKIMSW